MDQKEFFVKAERALNQAFEAAKKSAKVVAEKAGEAAHVTKLLVEKVSLEHQVSRQFARLGASVYEKAACEGKESLLQDSEIQSLIEQAKGLEAQLARVEASLENEKKFKKESRASSGKSSAVSRKR